MQSPVEHASPLNWALNAVSRGYGLAVKFRNHRYATGKAAIFRLPCAVVSVGNLSVGGTGKTPMTIFLARKLQKRGLGCVILSRGYGGTAGHRGGLVSDGRQMLLTAREAGDEPYMMACTLPDTPVMVGHDRYVAGLKAFDRFHPDVILLDDGFQHRRLHRDVDVVLMDAKLPLGNGCLFPRGILREPPAALNRAHLLVLTRADQGHPPGMALLRAQGMDQPLFVADHQMHVCHGVPHGNLLQRSTQTDTTPVWEALRGRRALVFSGVARPRQFEAGIAQKGIHVIDSLRFDDHYDYRTVDQERIQFQAKRYGADLLITTQKDFVRMNKQSRLAYDLIVVDAAIRFYNDGGSLFLDRICQHLRK